MNTICKFRKKANLTQKELAKMLKIRQSAVSMWETTGVLPRADKLPQLAKILKCSIDELLSDRKVV